MNGRKADADASPRSARDWLALVLDEGWSTVLDGLDAGDPLGFPGYPEQRAKATGDEAVVVARGAIDRYEAVVVAFEFGYLGGSMGVAAGEKIARAFELAADEMLPLFALTASGGARMQEGMLALAQMPATINARRRLADAKQPFVCYLRNPTTGGVYASFANTADLLWAQPGATIGFAGPRVAATMTGEELPEDSHTAEYALANGTIDEIVPPEELRARCEDVVGLLDGRSMGPLPPLPEGFTPDTVDRDPWERVQMARAPGRPTGVDYLVPHLPLARGGVDPTMRTGMMKLGPHTVVIAAQDRRAGTGRTAPAGFRKARHAFRVARNLGLPIITFVDTPGADPSATSEADGVAREIASTFDELLGTPVVTVACVVGEGGSGGALAFAACDRLLIQTNAIFSVIAPEGAASILRRDDVDEVARAQRLTARDLLDSGLADRVIGEPDGGAHTDPTAARTMVLRETALALEDALTDGAPTDRREQRWRARGRTL